MGLVRKFHFLTPSISLWATPLCFQEGHPHSFPLIFIKKFSSFPLLSRVVSFSHFLHHPQGDPSLNLKDEDYFPPFTWVCSHCWRVRFLSFLFLFSMSRPIMGIFEKTSLVLVGSVFHGFEWCWCYCGRRSPLLLSSSCLLSLLFFNT